MKSVEKKKYIPSEIVNLMKNEGFSKFSMYYHTQLWKSRDGRKTKYNFGGGVSRQWYWYENWVNEVRDHCIKINFSTGTGTGLKFENVL